MQRLHSSWSFNLPVSKTPMSLDPCHASSSTMDGPDSFFVLGLRESSSLRTRDKPHASSLGFDGYWVSV
jgi:hypothetical protein